MASSVHPEYRDVVKTYTDKRKIKIIEIPFNVKGLSDYKSVSPNDDVSCVVIQYPNFFGSIEDVKGAKRLADEKKALLVILSIEPVSLGILKSPGELGCDIFVSEGQSFGNPMNFGGPHLGVMATKKAYIRNLPGRIVSRTKDSEGKTGYVLYLSTREQHIRREKATSNICTNNALCALRALIYLSLLGQKGFKSLAEKNLWNAVYLKEKLSGIRGVRIQFESPFFNEFVYSTGSAASVVLAKFKEEGIIGGFPLGRYYKEFTNSILVNVTEMKTKKGLDQYAEALKKSM